MVEEARLEQVKSGLTPATEGWFVVNVGEAAWEAGPFGAGCFFEAPGVPFPELGFNLRVLVPGQSRWLYHAESTQEDFLVLAGECLLLVEEEERPLRAWDFVHCPGGTRHAFVATGDDPCIIAMAGARTAEQTFLYPLSELACRHGVGVEQETTSPTEAQGPSSEWRLERPNRWADLPWA